MPTFNDLYYADMGNSKLDPEYVTQYNLGTVYQNSGGINYFAILRYKRTAIIIM